MKLKLEKRIQGQCHEKEKWQRLAVESEEESVRERTERLYDGMCQTTTQGELQLRRSTETCWGRKRTERDRLKPKLPELTFQGSLLTPSGHTVPWPLATLQQVQTHTFVRIELWRNKRYLSVFF